MYAAHTCHGVHEKVIRQLYGVTSLLMWVPEVDSGHRACVASSLHAELSCQLPSFCLFLTYPPTYLPPSIQHTEHRKGKVYTPRNLELRCKKAFQPRVSCTSPIFFRNREKPQ